VRESEKNIELKADNANKIQPIVTAWELVYKDLRTLI